MEMQTEESERIATLTASAIKASGEKVCQDILAAVEAAEQTARSLREEAERIIGKFNTDTAGLAARIRSFVLNCQSAMNAIQVQQLRIFEMDDSPAPNATPKADDKEIAQQTLRQNLARAARWDAELKANGGGQS